MITSSPQLFWAQKFSSVGDFVSAIGPGRGFKTPTHVYAHMDRHTAGQLRRGVRKALAEESEWWILSEVPVAKLRETHTSTMRTDLGDLDLSVPLVLGSRLQILDGRHRTALAKQRGLRTLTAWMPAAAFYRLWVNGARNPKSKHRKRKGKPNPSVGRLVARALK